MTDFEYGTEYRVQAFVGNGRNEVYSFVHVFVTPDKAELEMSEPEMSEPDAPSHEVPDPALPGQYEFALPFYEILVNPNLNTGVEVKTTRNVRFETIVPEDVDWLWVDYAGERTRYIYTYCNCTGAERSCDVVFKSLDHDCQYVLKVTQEHLEPIVINKSYKQEVFPLYLDSKLTLGLAVNVDENGRPYAPDWVDVVTYRDYVKIDMKENKTSQTRFARIKLECDQETVLYFLYQAPKQ